MSEEAKRIIKEHDRGEGSFSSEQMYEAYSAGETLGYQKGRAYERKLILDLARELAGTMEEELSLVEELERVLKEPHKD